MNFREALEENLFLIFNKVLDWAHHDSVNFKIMSNKALADAKKGKQALYLHPLLGLGNENKRKVSQSEKEVSQSFCFFK